MEQTLWQKYLEEWRKANAHPQTIWKVRTTQKSRTSGGVSAGSTSTKKASSSATKKSFQQFEELLTEELEKNVQSMVIDDDDPVWNLLQTFDPKEAREAKDMLNACKTKTQRRAVAAQLQQGWKRRFADVRAEPGRRGAT